MKNTGELTIAPDTHNLPIRDFYTLAKSFINFYRQPEMAEVLNGLYRACREAADQPGQYEALKRAISPNYVPEEIEPGEIEASDLAIDALAVWALFTLRAWGTQTDRDVAKPLHIPHRATSTLLPVLDKHLGFNHQTAKPSYKEVARVYYDVERQGWAAQP